MLTRNSTFSGTVAGVPVSGTIEASHKYPDGRLLLRVKLPAPIMTIRGSVDSFNVIVNADGSPQTPTVEQEPDAATRARIADTAITLGVQGDAGHDPGPAAVSLNDRLNAMRGRTDTNVPTA